MAGKPGLRILFGSGCPVGYEIHAPEVRYVDDFFKMKCAPDLLLAKIYPNVKEVTESAGAYAAVRKHLRLDLTDPNVTCVCVGDGATPRTGAMFAFRSAWNVVSVDPLLKMEGKWKSIDRLLCVKSRIEDYKLITDGPMVIIGTHSHATIPACLAQLHSHSVRHLVAIPCCVPLEIPGKSPYITYRDWGIWSPENEVSVWRDI